MHVNGTEEQSDSELWHELRKFRVTGSKFKDYVKGDPVKMAAAQWKPPVDLGKVRSVKWGRENEDNARIDYERAKNVKISKCGLFVSDEDPIFAASPDGVNKSEKCLLEIKCPFSLKDVQLNTLENVPSSQFFTCPEAGKLVLKQNHAYFYQVQLAMYVTGYRKTDFMI